MAKEKSSRSGDWTGEGPSDPPETSAPLHPPGRKRWDPRAPYGTAPGGGPPPPVPPIIWEGGSEGGTPGTPGTPGVPGVPGTPPGQPPGTMYPLCPTTGYPLYQNQVTFTGTSLPGAAIKIYVADPGPYVGQMIGSGIADGAGVWTVVIPRDFPDGFYCVTATQTIVGFSTSEQSDDFCFHVGQCVGSLPLPPQTIDFVTQGLRHDPTLNWYHGTLAYKINGVWTYGVLRKVV